MRDRLLVWFVKLLPRRVIYFAVLRAWSFASTGKYEYTAGNRLTVLHMLQRWTRG